MLQAQAGVTDFQENMEALKHNFFLSGYFKKRGYEDSADLAANRIGGLPQATPEKTFTYAAKQLFDGRDSAKMKDQKMSQSRRRLPGADINSDLRWSWFPRAWMAIPRRISFSPRPGRW